MFNCPLCLKETEHETRAEFQLSNKGTLYSICPSCNELMMRLRRSENVLPPKECGYCGNKLNVYVGSHTSLRVETLNGVKWMCVKCFEGDQAEPDSWACIPKEVWDTELGQKVVKNAKSIIDSIEKHQKSR